MQKHTFFYLNADNKIGSGHFWRCFSIANELSRFYTGISILYSSLSDALLQKAKHNNFTSYQLNDTAVKNFTDAIKLKSSDKNSALLIIDSDNTSFYEKEFQLGIIDAGIRLTIITINTNFHYYANILINQNIIACYQNYSTETYTRKLFGPFYFIYTPQFRKLGLKPAKPIGKNVFISFGSADPCHYTIQLVKKMVGDKFFDSFNFHVVVGALNQDYDEIKMLCGMNDNIQLHCNISDVSDIMLQCNLAFCAPGLMFWELALMGVKAILFSGSEREKSIGVFFGNHKYAYAFHSCDEVFDGEKFESLKSFLSNLREETFRNFSELRKTINPEGVTKICDEINHILHS
jgi:UDP-2,4-diacetamido-2,4,6-trideoxy-beta-L-altropyranose hydrolase